jgi:hypothetical protein
MHPILPPNSYRVIWIFDVGDIYSEVMHECEAFEKEFKTRVRIEVMVRLWFVHILSTQSVRVDGLEEYWKLWDEGIVGDASLAFVHRVLNNLLQSQTKLLQRLPPWLTDGETGFHLADTITTRMWLSPHTLKLLVDVGYINDASHYPTA